MNLSKAMQQRRSWGSGGAGGGLLYWRKCVSQQLTCVVVVAGSHPEHFASPAVWHSLGGAGVWPFTFWLLPRPRSWFLNRSCSLKFTAIVLKPHSFRLLTWEDGPGSDRCPNASGKFEKYYFGFATGQPPALPKNASPVPIYTHTHHSQHCCWGLQCNVNILQKTVWSIPVNAVTCLMWVFYCVVTCIV